MPITRLGSIAPDLVAYLEDLPEPTLRRIAWAVSRWVANEVPVSDARVVALLAGPPATDSALRAEMEVLVSELDEIACDIQDLVDEGRADYADYSSAFDRARSVNALWSAMDPSPIDAARESIYEARAATDDMSAPHDMSALDQLVRSVR